MNKDLALIADVVNQLSPSNLMVVRDTLQDVLAGLRNEVKTTMNALNASGPETDTFNGLATSTADLAQTIEIVKAAAADVAKLEATAKKILDRVQKRLSRYKK